MEDITAFARADFYSVFIAVFTILIGLKAIVSLFEWITGKLGLETKWTKQRKKEHELLHQTSKNLAELQDKHVKSVEQSIMYDKEIKEELSAFMTNMTHSVEDLKNKQNEIVCTVNKIVESNKIRDEAAIEEMCDRIGQKTRYYINVLHGIPEDEYDDFVRLFSAYEAIGGNHGAKKKYEYCINHLEVLPIQKRVITEKNK